MFGDEAALDDGASRLTGTPDERPWGWLAAGTAGLFLVVSMLSLTLRKLALEPLEPI